MIVVGHRPGFLSRNCRCRAQISLEEFSTWWQANKDKHTGVLGSMESLRAKAAHKHKASAPPRRNWARRWFAIEVSRHDIAGIWVAFFQECQ